MDRSLGGAPTSHQRIPRGGGWEKKSEREKSAGGGEGVGGLNILVVSVGLMRSSRWGGVEGTAVASEKWGGVGGGLRELLVGAEVEERVKEKKTPFFGFQTRIEGGATRV